MEKHRFDFQRWLKHLVKAAGRSKSARMYFGTLGGRLFENIAIRTLAGGGSFKIHSQHPPSRRWWNWVTNLTQLTLAATSEGDHIDIVDEPFDIGRSLHRAGMMPNGNALIALRMNLGIRANDPDPILPSNPRTQFGIPASPTFPAIDAFHLQPPRTRHGITQPAVWRLFQMKNVQEFGKREIKVTHLNRFLTYVPLDVIVELYQVVPMSHWLSGQVKPFLYCQAESGDVDSVIPVLVACPSRIHEYVLIIPDDVVAQA